MALKLGGDASGNSPKSKLPLALQPVRSVNDKSVLTMIVQGPKDAGKSCNVAGIKAPKGGRKVIVACDDTTSETLVNYYGEDFLKDCELYEVTRRVVDDNGDETYSGYDPNDPKTGVVVIEAIRNLLDQLDQDSDVSMLVVDHFQALYEQVAQSYARANTKEKLGPEDQLEFHHWRARTDIMNLIEAKIRRVPVPGGIAIITGYTAEEKSSYKEVLDPKTGRQKRVVVREIKEPKWLKDDIRRNWLVNVLLTTTLTGSSGGGSGKSVDQYFAEVISSKAPRFEKGLKVEITGKSLQVFWDET